MHFWIEAKLQTGIFIPGNLVRVEIPSVTQGGHESGGVGPGVGVGGVGVGPGVGGPGEGPGVGVGGGGHGQELLPPHLGHGMPPGHT